jgi:Cu(I)/Ag(I) efflux system protein CusF
MEFRMKAHVLAAALVAAASSFAIAAPALAHEGHQHPAAVPQSAEGEGAVTAIDAQGGTVTLNHGPIASLGWPAMTMTFRVQAASVLQGISVGQRVHFVLVNDNGRPVVSAIHVL